MDNTPASFDGRMTPTHAAQPLRGVLPRWLLDVVLTLVIGFALMTLAGLMWGVLTGVRSALQGANADAVGAAIASPGALAQIGMVLLASATTALLIYVWRQPATSAERRYAYQQMRRPQTWALSIATAVALFAGTTLVTWLLHTWGMAPSPANLAVIRAALAQSPIFVVLFTVVAAPLYEELLFRRVLFGRLWKAGRPVLGMWLSGFAFALSHEVPGLGQGPLAATLCLVLVYAAMGASFAWLYKKTGSLWAAVLAHAVNNALALFVLLVSGP